MAAKKYALALSFLILTLLSSPSAECLADDEAISRPQRVLLLPIEKIGTHVMKKLSGGGGGGGGGGRGGGGGGGGVGGGGGGRSGGGGGSGSGGPSRSNPGIVGGTNTATTGGSSSSAVRSGRTTLGSVMGPALSLGLLFVLTLV